MQLPNPTRIGGWTISRWIFEGLALAGLWVLIYFAWLVLDACLVLKEMPV